MEEVRIVNPIDVYRNPFIDWDTYYYEMMEKGKINTSYPVLKEKAYLLTKVFCNFYGIEIVKVKEA